MTATATTVDNPYWDAVKDHVDWAGRWSLWRTPSVGSLDEFRTAAGDLDMERWHREGPRRHDLVERYSWTIPDPQTLAFVAEHSRGAVVDPMAGTGYWARLLTDMGVNVICYDAKPGTNHWHDGHPLHFEPITRLDAADAVALHPDRTLLLSWPPMDDAGTRALRAYYGPRVVLIGEGEGGCTGDDDLFADLAEYWTEVDSRIPVQWDGLHDVVTVYDRNAA